MSNGKIVTVCLGIYASRLALLLYARNQIYTYNVPHAHACCLCPHPQVIEVASSTDAEGRVVYDPDELVLAIGQLILGGQQQPYTPASAAAAAAATAGIHGLSLSQ